MVKVEDTSITACNIHEGTKVIYYAAFSGCDALESVSIPDGVPSLGDYAFENCSSLAELTVPDSVTSIGEGTFSCCVSLESVAYSGTGEEWNAIDKASGWDSNTGNYTVHCTDGDFAKSL